MTREEVKAAQARMLNPGGGRWIRGLFHGNDTYLRADAIALADLALRQMGEIEKLRGFARGVLGPEVLNYDALDEAYGKMVADQWEGEWCSEGEANAAGFNEGLAERDRLVAENAKLRQCLQGFVCDRHMRHPPVLGRPPKCQICGRRVAAIGKGE